MTADLQPYDERKDSGVPWIGPVPKHWEHRRLKSLLRPVDQRSSTGTETLLSLRRSHGVVIYSEHFARPPQGATTIGYKLVRAGQLVLNRLQANNGLVFDSPYDGLVSPDYSVFELRQSLRMRFLSLLLRTHAYKDHFRREATGLGTGSAGFLRLYDDRFLETPVCLPSLAEQDGALRFLDYADRHIRRYVRAKKKLMALLEEQKQVFVHAAVARGLDLSVRLRPSGVEGLGEIPEHWEVRRLKWIVCRIDQGASPQAENRLADEGAWGVVKAGCVNRGVFREEEHKRLPSGYSVDPTLAVGVGDVLISRASGSPNLVGSVGRVRSLRYNLMLSDKTFRPVFGTGVDPDFMVLAMNSRYYRQQVERAISGAEGLANNLPLSQLRGFRFAVPPVQEQIAIVEHVRIAINAIDAAANRTQREISLLNEYYARLTADVLTGNVDVRDAARRLAEVSGEAQAPAPEDSEFGDDVDDEDERAIEEAEA